MGLIISAWQPLWEVAKDLETGAILSAGLSRDPLEGYERLPGMLLGFCGVSRDLAWDNSGGSRRDWGRRVGLGIRVSNKTLLYYISAQKKHMSTG